MTTIQDVITVEGRGAFFHDDQMAIRGGREKDGFLYAGDPVTDGFEQVRMPVPALGIGLVLSNGEIVWGDALAVQYAGASGREPVPTHRSLKNEIGGVWREALVGASLDHFSTLCDRVSSINAGAATRYGCSQALLRAVATNKRRTATEVICEEFDLPLPTGPCALYAQSGDDRHTAVDKMVLKGVDILPHGLINSAEKFGPQGETFLEFVRYVASRVKRLGTESYKPRLHFDVYGWIGLGISENPTLVAEFIAQAQKAAHPFDLHIECPVDYGSTAAQIDGYAKIVTALERLGCTARIVADEHCNSIEDMRAFATARAAHIIQIKMPDVGLISDTIKAALHCRAEGAGVYVGGSCTETDLSAQLSADVALAVGAEMLLAKPGMGMDEGLTIVGNAQLRTLAEISHRGTHS
ncbi:methylaspartate ammonia-lyase [Roseibium sp. TrichSKD4]|uniref:methylaspartate ammonia-lyase n=1 Tax=Roseibium sp. TrichSKD4 TaxID=744980 RepID=UPI0001E5683A|nr:methylaspartate ammonia-lyase [Roseibium sp. TrichSKD4]EFO31265.1 methylaspartate ammonia-lyase [Roseibium sp. TrichSKD4]